METIDWAFKAREAAKLADFIEILSNGCDDGVVSYCSYIMAKTTTLTYNGSRINKTSEEIFLDGETREVIIDMLSKQLEELKRELKEGL